MKTKSTKVTKILEHYHINYELFSYEQDNRLKGSEIAILLGEEPDKVFKTLLTKSSKEKKYYIFAIPVNSELDLKKCAKEKQEKSIEMCLEREMKTIVGYVHGGCSIIGIDNQKIEISVQNNFFNYDYIYISAGEVGYQVKVNPSSLKEIINIKSGDFIK